jgi:ribosomal protein S18 acetylase RimI-like enzyme
MVKLFNLCGLANKGIEKEVKFWAAHDKYIVPELKNELDKIIPNIQYRDAQKTDEEFVNTLTRTTMREYVEATWASEEKRELYYEVNRFRQEGTEIILYDGTDVGQIAVSKKDDRIIIDEIHILPEYQGKGIGKRVLQNVLEYAFANNLPVELFLLRTNPVKRLYERLGFKVYKEDEFRYYMTANS